MTTPYYTDDHVTLWHGDCREIAEWLNADVLVTDPPYGIAYASGWARGRDVAIAGDQDTALRDRIREMWSDRGPWLMFGTWRHPRPEGTDHVLVWDKTDGVGPGMGDLTSAFGSSHEEVYLGGKWPKREERKGSVLRTKTSPSALTRETGHPTPKPVDLMQALVAVSDGVVADPFAGSGSTLVAARNLGRRAIGVELEERYCEIIARRLDQGVLDFGGDAA